MDDAVAVRGFVGERYGREIRAIAEMERGRRGGIIHFREHARMRPQADQQRLGTFAAAQGVPVAIDRREFRAAGGLQLHGIRPAGVARGVAEDFQDGLPGGNRAVDGRRGVRGAGRGLEQNQIRPIERRVSGAGPGATRDLLPGHLINHLLQIPPGIAQGDVRHHAAGAGTAGIVRAPALEEDGAAAERIGGAIGGGAPGIDHATALKGDVNARFRSL